MSLNTLRIVSLSLILTACGDALTDGPNGNGGNGGDDSVTGSATITVEVDVLGTPVSDCPITLTDGGAYTGTSGSPITVEAPDTLTLDVGDPQQKETFGFPVYVSSDGEYWATPITTIDVIDGDEATKQVEMFNLFEPGDYSCSYDEYKYDASAPNFKGMYTDTYSIDTQGYAVDQTGKVILDTDPRMGTILGSTTDGDYLQVKEDYLSLMGMGATGDNPRVITTSEIKKNFFSFTEVWTGGHVYDASCTKKN